MCIHKDDAKTKLDRTVNAMERLIAAVRSLEERLAGTAPIGGGSQTLRPANKSYHPTPCLPTI